MMHLWPLVKRVVTLSLRRYGFETSNRQYSYKPLQQACIKLLQIVCARNCERGGCLPLKLARRKHLEGLIGQIEIFT